HLLRHIFSILVRGRPFRAATTHKLRRIARTMTCATSALLPIPLGRGAADFATALNFMQTEAGIRHLANICLVHQTGIDFDFKNIGREVNVLDLFTVDVYHWNLHWNYSSRAPYRRYLPRRTRAGLMRTIPPFTPGT